MKILNKFVILNSEAEDIEAWRDNIKATCQAESIEILEIARDDVSSTNEDMYVLISGGDGSLRYAAEFIKENKIENSATLLYHPNGTGNDFSRSVSLHKLKMSEVCSLILTGQKIPLDLAKCNEISFINMGSFGVFAEVTPETDEDSKKALGGFSYYLEGLKKVLNLEDFSCNFTVDGENVSFPNVLGFFIGNSRFCGAGIQVTPDAKINDGYLDFLIIKNAPKTDLFQLAIELQKDCVDLSEFDVYSKKVKSVKFQASRPLSITLDGEPQKAAEGLVTLHSNKLSIIVPQGLEA